MTDTITLPSGIEVYEGKVLVLPGIGVVMPTGDLTSAEAADLRADVATAMNQDLDDLANVSETGKASGMVLKVLADGTWGASANQWGLRSVTNGTTLIAEDVVTIYAEEPVRFGSSGTAGAAWLRLAMGSSGTQNVAARADHAHPPVRKGEFPFSKGAAVLSSGVSTLVDDTISTMVAGVIYDIDLTGTLEAVNTNASGRLRLYLQIGSNTPISLSRGFSGGVFTSVSIHGSHMSITGGTSIAVKFWAEYESGDPTALYTGQLAFRCDPRGGTN